MINKLSPLPNFLVSRYKSWKSTKFVSNSKKYKTLATLGQNPNSMIISCCDSRVHVTSLFGAEEGEFFIHRNIANLVPPYSTEKGNYGTSAVIEYAIKELKINHIIILGHTGCGGIKSAYNLNKSKHKHNYMFIDKWLKIILPAFKNISKNSNKIKEIKILEEESIKNSLRNLYSFPNVKKNVEENKLTIHGLIHDIGSGNLKFLNPLTKEFENI